MSPIAASSYRESAGRAIKGSGRKVNSAHRRPSILELLETAGTIDALAAMRAEMAAALAEGTIAPSEKTQRAWLEALWVRVLELMALQPRQAPYIYNATLAWPKPPGLERALDQQLRRVTAPLPSDAELLRAQGITIEGVTS